MADPRAPQQPGAPVSEQIKFDDGSTRLLGPEADIRIAHGNIVEVVTEVDGNVVTDWYSPNYWRSVQLVSPIPVEPTG